MLFSGHFHLYVNNYMWLGSHREQCTLTTQAQICRGWIGAFPPSPVFLYWVWVDCLSL